MSWTQDELASARAWLKEDPEHRRWLSAQVVERASRPRVRLPLEPTKEREGRPRNVLGGRFPTCGHPIDLETVDWHPDAGCGIHPETGKSGYWRCRLCRQAAKRAADEAKRHAAAAVKQGGAR